MISSRNIILATLASLISMSGMAHPIDSVLAEIEQNNITLKALNKSNEAEITAGKSANNLGETSVEYSPFYATGVSGVASSELVVSQSFDFPTLYAARNKANVMKETELGLRFRLTRRDILLEAHHLCLDIIHINKKMDILEQRMEIANRLLQLYERKTEEGDATIIELNKVKMERMEIAAEAEALKSDLKTAEAKLTFLNGNRPITLTQNTFPSLPVLPDDSVLYSQYLSSDVETRVAEAQAKTTQQNISISKQNWLPKLTVGYRRNTNLDEAVNGFLVGASIPLFSNRHKTKEAKAVHESTIYELEDTKAQSRTSALNLIAELRHTEQAMSAYDTALMEQTLALLAKAVEAGEMSSIDYFREADAINASMTKYLELQRKYHGIISDIRKNEI